MRNIVINNMRNIVILLLAVAFLWHCECARNNTLEPGDELDHETYLYSSSGKYILGFINFAHGFSNNYYFGIADRKIGQMVWNANRNDPYTGDERFQALTLEYNGTLMIKWRGKSSTILFSSPQPIKNTLATLLDTGNFVLQQLHPNGSVKSLLWQSFDYPTDKLLPGMKLGVNHKTNVNWTLISYLAGNVPASGAFTLEWEPQIGQLMIRRRGIVIWASGVLKNNKFEYLSNQGMYEYTIVNNEDESSLLYIPTQNGEIYYDMLALFYNGQIIDGKGNAIARGDLCYGYNNNVDGCQIVENIIIPSCRHVDEIFDIVLTNIRFSDNNISIVANKSLGLSDCRDACWNDCGCNGFNSYNGDGDGDGTGCVFFKGNLWERAHDVGGQRSYYMLVRTSSEKNNSWKKRVIIIIVMGAVLFVCCGFILWLVKRKRCLIFKDKRGTKNRKAELDLVTFDPTMNSKESQNSKMNRHDLRIFSYESIVAATNDFSSQNKLGEGGFGPVYKGQLQVGKEVAVKRLSRSSRQGIIEFKNELRFISELQHTNVVQLLGCCIHEEERILIYEYMPNKSLDFFLFDSAQCKLLDWKKRFNIIEGIAQGLLYLHKYSRLRVVHRDLKASNILLDENFNPKISDFGMAKIFAHESECNTNRIVGTYGYMSPEYAMEGVFSIKLDVYSFGVLMLEIVSGRRNSSFYNIECPQNLVGYTWELWKKGEGVELVDPTLNDSLIKDQVLRCIHIGLLCVEQSAIDRPTMSDILSMLTNETTMLSHPKMPAFSFGRRDNAEQPGIDHSKLDSINGFSFSDFSGR